MLGVSDQFKAVGGEVRGGPPNIPNSKPSSVFMYSGAWDKSVSWNLAVPQISYPALHLQSERCGVSDLFTSDSRNRIKVLKFCRAGDIPVSPVALQVSFKEESLVCH